MHSQPQQCWCKSGLWTKEPQQAFTFAWTSRWHLAADLSKAPHQWKVFASLILISLDLHDDVVIRHVYPCHIWNPQLLLLQVGRLHAIYTVHTVWSRFAAIRRLGSFIGNDKNSVSGKFHRQWQEFIGIVPFLPLMGLRPCKRLWFFQQTLMICCSPDSACIVALELKTTFERT